MSQSIDRSAQTAGRQRWVSASRLRYYEGIGLVASAATRSGSRASLHLGRRHGRSRSCAFIDPGQARGGAPGESTSSSASASQLGSASAAGRVSGRGAARPSHAQERRADAAPRSAQRPPPDGPARLDAMPPLSSCPRPSHAPRARARTKPAVADAPRATSAPVSTTQGAHAEGTRGTMVDGYEATSSVDDYTVGFETYTADADLTPLFAGLPDDRCQCVHWGYVIKGKLTYKTAAGEETFRPATPTTSVPATPGALRRHRGRGVQPHRALQPRSPSWRSMAAVDGRRGCEPLPIYDATAPSPHDRGDEVQERIELFERCARTRAARPHGARRAPALPGRPDIEPASVHSRSRRSVACRVLASSSARRRHAPLIGPLTADPVERSSPTWRRAADGCPASSDRVAGDYPPTASWA